MTSRLRHPDGTPFRDLNHNGTMEPYEDPACRSTTASRTYWAG